MSESRPSKTKCVTDRVGCGPCLAPLKQGIPLGAPHLLGKVPQGVTSQHLRRCSFVRLWLNLAEAWKLQTHFRQFCLNNSPFEYDVN